MLVMFSIASAPTTMPLRWEPSDAPPTFRACLWAPTFWLLLIKVLQALISCWVSSVERSKVLGDIRFDNEWLVRSNHFLYSMYVLIYLKAWVIKKLMLIYCTCVFVRLYVLRFHFRSYNWRFRNSSVICIYHTLIHLEWPRYRMGLSRRSGSHHNLGKAKCSIA